MVADSTRDRIRNNVLLIPIPFSPRPPIRSYFLQDLREKFRVRTERAHQNVDRTQAVGVLDRSQGRRGNAFARPRARARVVEPPLFYTFAYPQVILSSNVYIDKSPEYRLFEPWLGNGLLISTGKCSDGDATVND